MAVRERELSLAKEVLQREFGDSWKEIVQTLGTRELRECVGKKLTSFLAYPNRGKGGDNRWRGNCSPEVVKALVRYVLEERRFYGKGTEDFILMDPMSGSGTSADAAGEMAVKAVLYDLNPEPEHGRGGWNALTDEVDESASLIFLHPPYHSIIRYSGGVWGKPHPDDLSRCENYSDFIEKLNLVVRKLFFSLRSDGYMALLVGDVRQKGRFYSIANDVMKIGRMASWIVKGQFNCNSSGKTYNKPFIPIVTEHLLLFHKDEAVMIPYSIKREGVFDVSRQDVKELTWFHLVRATMEDAGEGKMSLQELYERLSGHPKAVRNKNYRERIRATIYENRKYFLTNGKGVYKLAY